MNPKREREVHFIVKFFPEEKIALSLKAIWGGFSSKWN